MLATMRARLSAATLSCMRRNLAGRVARWSARHPWRAIIAWALFVAAALFLGSATGTHSATDADGGFGDSGRAAAIVRDAGLAPPATESVLVSTRSGPIEPAIEFASQLAGRLRSVEGVQEVGQPVPGSDHSTVLIPVTLAGDPATAADRIEPMLAATAAAQAERPDLRVEQVGNASGQHGVQEQLGHDFERAEVISVPLTLAILVIAFGAIVAAGVPLILALSSVAAAIGLSALASHVIPDGGTTTNMILLMGMAVGVDYSMFYVRREREERARGRARLEAVEVAAATAGRAATMSGCAVIVAMAGLYVTRDITFASLATGSILVVLVAMAGCLTVLPALLAKLGNALDWPRLRRRRLGPSRLWPVLLRPALRRPALTLALSTVAMVALATPLVSLTLRDTNIADLPRQIPAVPAYERLVAAFPVRVATHEVAVEAPADRAAQVETALASLGDPGGLRASADGRTHVLTLPADDGDSSAVQSLRERAAAALGAIPGVRYAVGGRPARALDYAAHQREKLPWVMGFVLVLTFVVMLLAFRSVVLALVSILVNGLSAAAAFGLLVLVFQHRWAEGLLGFTSTGAVVSWIPLFLFVVLFGLSMDYHIFVLSRIREATAKGLPIRAAVAEGITISAPVVTSAAAVMVAVFATFATLSLMEFKQLGVGLAAAVLIDAIVVRILILPAIISLLGRWAWWPSRVAAAPLSATAVPAPVPVRR
jgi:putative drug exporter of the RND superfamily